MARATLSTIQRIVYDNLGITNQSTGYGNLLTNQRYLSGYINDKIAEADIITVSILFKNKQLSLLEEIYDTLIIDASGDEIPQHWLVVNVTIDGNFATELDHETFTLISEGGIFDISTYKNYFAVRDSRLYFIGTAANAVFINLTHPTTLVTLKSPSGFEGAVANLASSLLLMKRGDKPEQAAYYRGLYDDFMKTFMIPDSNRQEYVLEE